MEIEELQAILEEKDAGGGSGGDDGDDGGGQEEVIKYTTEEIEEEIEEEYEIIEEEIEVDEGEEYTDADYVEDDGETEYVTEILEEEREESANVDQGNEQSIEAMVESMDSLGEQEADAKQHDEQLNGDNANNYDAEWQVDDFSDPLAQQQSIKQFKNATVRNGTSSKVYRSKKSQNTVQYEQQMQIPRHNDEDDIDNNVDGELNQTLVEQEEYEDENPHEIVKNTENNLVYTVLGTNNKKKKDEGANFKMDKLDDGTVPIEGTVYYEGDDMRTYYVAQAYNENEQYFEEQVLDTDEQQDQQQWEESADNIVTEELEQEQPNENAEVN